MSGFADTVVVCTSCVHVMCRLCWFAMLQVTSVFPLLCGHVRMSASTRHRRCFVRQLSCMVTVDLVLLHRVIGSRSGVLCQSNDAVATAAWQASKVAH